MKGCVPLEPAAEKVCDQSAVSPLIFRLSPREAREVLEKAQDAEVYKYPAEVSREIVDTGKWGKIPLYIVTPEGKAPKNAIFYIHGGGWVLGSFHTHDKLVRELCARCDAVVIFPEYTRSPEAKYPKAIEQCYYIMSHLRGILDGKGLDISNLPLTVAGDSVGGNMAIAMALMARERCGDDIDKLLLYYPVTNACFDTPSYRTFASCYYLYREGMMWFWRQYAPCEKDRLKITASPLLASENTLKCLPPTMVINGRADVLLSEGEAFVKKLQCAGVDVTALEVPGTIHDFVMLNALDQTNACRAAMDASTAWINKRCSPLQ